ncbi:MAG: hypothetical protein LBR10_07860 [Prevotellaceae bacterium]|jgi:hypothetical protein|nr:hypothetical protein [Prevotellaceae bacterium]
MKIKVQSISKSALSAMLLVFVVCVCCTDNGLTYFSRYRTIDLKTHSAASVGGSESDEQAAENNALIGRWSFDLASNAGRNVASNKYHASVQKNIRIVPGVFGNAAELSSKGTKIEISADVLPAGLREFTFSAWLAPKTLTASSTIIRKEDVGSHGDNRLLFAFQNDGRFLSLGINCGGNYAECDAVVSPKELCDGKWHFAAGTFDGKTMHVYLDGKEIGSMERQAPLSTIHDFSPIATWRDNIASSDYKTLEDAVVHDVPMFIGSHGGSKDLYNGRIDDVRFYSEALDGKHISALYAEGRQPSSAVLNKAQETAKALYKKGDTFLETLVTTDKNLMQSASPSATDELAAVELQRLIRNDYPEETNAYIAKWEKSPVNNMLLEEKERRSHAEKLAPAAFEYLPLTDMQWSVLPKADRAKWEGIKKIQSQFTSNTGNWVANMDKNLLGAAIYEMETVVEERPRKNEGVAPYVQPKTPPTVNRTAEEARKVMEADWLFQCDNQPVVGRSLQEIGWARKLLTRLALDDNSSKTYSAKLNELETQAKSKTSDSEDPELYFAVRTLKREIMFRNPVIDFESIMYIDNPNPNGSEWPHETRHRLGYMAVPGGRLIVQKGLSPEGKMTQLMPQEPLHGTFWRPDLSFDGKRILFSFKPHNEKTFHIYEIGVDGSGLRQLTGGIFDDFDPIYLPDGKNIMFLTTRGHIYVRCMPPTNAFVMARMPLDTKPGDKNLYILSRSGEPEYTPSVMNDGRVIYTRWEYTDKPLWRAQSLWTMRQNGTQVQTFWGNQSVWPDLLKDARQIPGSERVMFTGSAHHDWFSGSIGIITPSQGFNFPNGLTKVTQDLEWPECGKAPLDPKESPDYHPSGKYKGYYSPYPLSEKDFIVSAKLPNGKFVLLLMDTDGNREIINEGAHNIWDAIPIRKRPVPPVHPDLVDWPSWEERDNPTPGMLYSNNVYEGAPQELKDKAKYLRIWSIEHKTYTYWFKRNYVSSGPEISAVQSEGVKKIIGTVPIESDGSVNFTAPSGIALHFQLLDENQRALQTMRSFTGVQPGESRGCLGCHESHTRTVRVTQMGKALQRSPSNITPAPWKDITVSYERYVQPTLDKYCAQCHQDPKHAGYKKFNATLRPGFLGFKEPYMSLLGSPTWGTSYKQRQNTCGGYGWADVIMVESYGTIDSAAYVTVPPMTKLSYKSRLVELMSNGKHRGVKVDPESLLRVIHWVDAMGPYYGAEELQKMEDPYFQGKDWLSQRPRVQTAPIVPRPGPFDPFETDEAYDTPDAMRHNSLPNGVKRE